MLSLEIHTEVHYLDFWDLFKSLQHSKRSETSVNLNNWEINDTPLRIYYTIIYTSIIFENLHNKFLKKNFINFICMLF